jgi:hypothetical protein
MAPAQPALAQKLPGRSRKMLTRPARCALLDACRILDPSRAASTAVVVSMPGATGARCLRPSSPAP